MKKIYLLSLGCPRNLLDSEILLGLLVKKNFIIVEEPEQADIAIVNTCGFIQDAKEEAIDAILQLARFKKEGKISKLVVTGCLSQRYPEELTQEIEEIDAIFGSSDITRIPDVLDTLSTGIKHKEVSPEPDFLYDHTYARELLTPPHFAYVKIQEGCSNNCSYCVIPRLKGSCRSRTIDSVLEEVKKLRADRDIKEAVLIGQDTTSFGIDRVGKSELADLLRKVSHVMEGGWVRLLYTHPVHFTDELIDVIASTDNICKYIDLPIQHISDKMLRVMNRKTTRDSIIDLIGRIRAGIKDVTLRTSIIVGFPDETDRDFRELLDFLEETRFERLGAFIYSREEGTPAADFEDQVSPGVKKDRFDTVMKLQQMISENLNFRYFHKTVKTLVDESDPSDPERFTGRGQMDAPEVDGVIFINGKGLKPGEFVDVRITGTMEYDLTGEAV